MDEMLKIIIIVCSFAIVEGYTVVFNGDCDVSGARGDVSGRVKALEEQVRQLQTLLHKDTVSTFTTVSGLPRDCEEIYNTGTRLDDVYTISPDGRCPFPVFCDMTHGGWTVIQKRFDGSVNFYQPWAAYVEGFGDMTGEHWLGLQKIHRLTAHGVQIYFNMTRTVDQVIDYAHYKYFAVNGGNTQYTMYADKFGYNGTLHDTGLTYHSGKKFTTHDRDNDDYGENCATEYGGGAWWHGGCYHLGNLNGLYGVSGRGGMDYAFTNHVYLSSVTMMIKQINSTC